MELMLRKKKKPLNTIKFEDDYVEEKDDDGVGVGDSMKATVNDVKEVVINHQNSHEEPVKVLKTAENSQKGLTGSSTEGSTEKTTNKFQPQRKKKMAEMPGARVDYGQDICKDYYETGFCGFGDSCKFIHTRLEQKSSWELEKEFLDQQQRQRKDQDKDNVDNFSKSTETPTNIRKELKICAICSKEPPIQATLRSPCHHLFCEECFIEQTENTCPTCKISLKGKAMVVVVTKNDDEKV